MNVPLVSVVIPCYNGAAFLRACVGSVLAQQVECEIIVVDDGSTDQSLELAKELVRDGGGRVLLAGQTNQGPAAARNLGLRLARGKYVNFLDADDAHAPGFLSAALARLEAKPGLQAVYSELEFVNCQRSVAPWQKEIVERTLVSNLVVRTELARRLGFPTDAAFRGRSAGEDCAFRERLHTLGRAEKLPAPLVRHLVRPGSHFDFFLDRSFMKEGRMYAKQYAPEEVDGSKQQAEQAYKESVLVQALGRGFETVMTTLQAANEYEACRQFGAVEGFLHPLEGFALYNLVRHWPAVGVVVEIGSFKGRSTCWLAAGCKQRQQGKVTAVDHFKGSPEHQAGASQADRDVATTGSTLPVFERNLRERGLWDWVTVHVGASAEVGRDWKEPIRLLFIDGDHSFEASAQDFHTWSPHVVKHGLVAIHDVGVWPGVTDFYQQVLGDKNRWRQIAQVNSLRVLQRVGT